MGAPRRLSVLWLCGRCIESVTDDGVEFPLWEETASARRETVSKVLRFFALTADPGTDHSIDSELIDPLWDHLGRLKAKWMDREEELIAAFIRRAYDQGTWDTDLLVSTSIIMDH